MGERRRLSPGGAAPAVSLPFAGMLAGTVLLAVSACSGPAPDIASQADLTLAGPSTTTTAPAESDAAQLSPEPGAAPGDPSSASVGGATTGDVPETTTTAAPLSAGSSAPAAPSSVSPRTTRPTAPPPLAAASTSGSPATAALAPPKTPSMITPSTPAATGPAGADAAAPGNAAGGSGPTLLTLGPGTPSAAEAQVIKLVNLERVIAGCAPLAANPVLVKVARAHSQEMSAPGAFRHNSPDGRTPFQRLKAVGYDYSIAAENIAAGQPNASTVMAAWLVSAEHKANMLDCRFTEIGVGVVNVPGSQYGTYWTQDIATPM